MSGSSSREQAHYTSRSGAGSRSGAARGPQGGEAPVAVADLEGRVVAVARDRGLDGLVVDHHPDEAGVEPAVLEELGAPGVEQHAVRRSADLHSLRDEAGQTEEPGLVGV